MQCDDASRDGSELCDGLGPLPEADLIADPHNLGGFGTDYYAAGTVRRLLAAERERWNNAVMLELDANGQAESIIRAATLA